MVYIQCKSCNYKEKVNKRFFIKVIGGGFVGGGFWAWVAYFFAGTGFALPICVAIVVGGVAMLAFSDEITKWIVERYDCPSCKKREWRLVKD
jgi:hypothetical protein